MTRTSLCFGRSSALLAALVALAVLAACSATQTPVTSQPAADASTPKPTENFPQPEGLTREDSQGAVTVKVTPLNLDARAATLDFAVVLDTHSVDLSMDLTQLAVLRTDTGAQVNATVWPVGSGHHYEATLSFPAQTAEGQSLLEGASTLTLVIADVDAPDRVFEWKLAQ
ncbi:MAG: hypothetical protein ABI847_07280 [Anaerolineales bacterium]